MADKGRLEMEQRLIEKAWKDEKFRKDLLADPSGTVSRELGVTLPKNVKVQVIEEGADTITLVIPARTDTPPSGQLSQADLEMVAGGWDMSGITCPATCQNSCYVCK